MYSYVVRRINADEKKVEFFNKSTVGYDAIIYTGSLVDLICAMNLHAFNLNEDFKQQSSYVSISSKPPDAPFGEGVFYVNYISDPTISCYMVCDKDGERHYEGVSSMGRLPHRKLSPGIIHESMQAKGLVETLKDKGIYCVGRVATWSQDETLNLTWVKLQQLKEELHVSKKDI